MRALFLLPALGLVLIGIGRSTPAPIIGVNDAPVLNTAASPVLRPAYLGAGAPVNGTVAGTPVSLLVDFATPVDGLDNVTDLDVAESDAGGSAQLGIAITTLGAGGTWYYSTNNGTTWSAAPVVSASNALLLAADAGTRLCFAAAGNAGSSSITFRAWDGATGVNGTTANTGTNGGSTAFSTATDVATIEVRGVRGSGSTSMSGGMSLTVPPPVGLQAGDLLVVGVAVAPTATVTTSAGLFTVLVNLNQPTANTSRLWLGYRVVTGSEPSYTFNFSVATNAVGGAIALAGMDITTPVDQSASVATPSTLMHTAPSITTTLARTLLTTWHEYASSSSWTPPAGMAEQVDMNSGQAASGVSLEGNTQLWISSGTTGTRTAVASANADAGATATATWRFANAAPALDNRLNPALAAVPEDGPPPAGAVGTLVSALVDLSPPAGGLDNVTDEDPGAVAGIAITNANSANGTWWWSVNNGSAWNPLGSPTGSTARLLLADAGTRLYFLPSFNYNGTIANALTVRAWDGTSGTNGGTADTGLNGGSTAFSAGRDDVSITVTPVNDAPTGSNLNAGETFTEDTPVNLTDIVVSDVDNTALTVTLTLSTPVAGALSTATSGSVTSTYVGGTGVWTASGAITDVNALLANLTFIPAANFNASFTIATSVSDGVAAPATGTKPITGIAANDPPVLNTAADPTMSPVTEDAPAPVGPVGTLVSALVDLNPPAGGLDNVTDVDPGALTGLAIVMVNDFLGTPYYSLDNGTVWNPVGPVNMSSARTLAADANTRVYFQPVANLSGGLSPFAFVAWDGTTGTNGGLSNANGGGAGTSAFSAAFDEPYLLVTAVNDAPQATNLNAGETYALNTPLDLTDIVVSDVDHATTTVSLSLSNTAAGSLNTGTSGAVTSTYNGGTGVWTASGAIADVNTLLAGLTFTPAPGFGSDFTIVPQVSDGVAPPLSGSKLFTGPGAQVVAIIPRVVLEGSYNASTGLMNGAMRTAGLVPVTEPYTAMGYTYVGSSGGSTTPAILAVGGADAVHDWVIVELRSAADPAVVVYSRAALLQRDGQVCDFDDVSPVTFNVPPGNYYLAVRHRNHLAAMTAGAIGYTATPSFLDMAAPGFPCYGTDAQKTIPGSFPAQALWAGDVTFNGAVKYTGSGNDRDPILVAVGSTTPNNTAAIYSTADVNLDGTVKYTGSGNDRDPILVNVGSTTPNNTRSQQLP